MSLHCGCYPPGSHQPPCPMAGNGAASSITTTTILPISPAPAETPARASWECHRCRAVNAPHVDRCSCSPYTVSPQVSPYVVPYVAPFWYPANPGGTPVDDGFKYRVTSCNLGGSHVCECSA